MNLRVQVVTEHWNPISASIRYITRSWASHVEFVDADSGYTLGARYKGGVQWRPALGSSHYTYIEWYTHPRIDDAVLWARSQIGKPYDLTAIFGILTDRKWQSPDSWFCSELVAAAFLNVGVPLFQPSTRLNRVFPGHIPMSLALTFDGKWNRESK